MKNEGKSVIMDGWFRPEEKLHRAIWNTLDELKQQSLVTPKDEWTLIGCETDEKKRAAQALKNSGAMKIVGSKSKPEPLGFEAIRRLQGIEDEPIGYYVDIVEPRFSEVVDLYYKPFGENEGHVSADEIEKLTAKLREWQGREIAVETSTPKKKEQIQNPPPKRKIEKLTFVPPSHGPKLRVIVNDDYQNTLHFDIKKPTGGLLLKLIEKGQEPPNHADNKESFDYLNSDKSQLITKTNCLQTKILHSEVGYIEWTIEVETITEATYKSRSGKAPKSA